MSSEENFIVSNEPSKNEIFEINVDDLNFEISQYHNPLILN